MTKTFNHFVGNHLGDRPGPPLERDRLDRAEATARGLEVTWADGHRARFSYRWLRFNCFCLECGTSDDGIRTIELTMIPRDITPATVAVTLGGDDDDGDGQHDVAIDWNGSDHRSSYGGDWLRANANSSRERARRRGWQPTRWKARPFDTMPVAHYEEVAGDEERRLEMFEALRDYGLMRVEGVGPDPELTEPVARLFGPIHETTLYGVVSDVQSKPVSKLGGETAIHQHPHCDDTFHYSPPGIVLFHCIANDVDDGGVSSYVDGFAVAEALRSEAPEAFRLLTTVPVQFIRRRPGCFDLRGEGRVIQLDDSGQVSGIRFFDRSSAPLDVDEDLVDPMLDAQEEFLRRIISPEFQVLTRLRPGNIVVVDNHRVMHGRSAFDPISDRRIRTCTVDRCETHARWRDLAFRHGRDDYDLHLSSGAI